MSSGPVSADGSGLMRRPHPPGPQFILATVDASVNLYLMKYKILHIQNSRSQSRPVALLSRARKSARSARDKTDWLIEGISNLWSAPGIERRCPRHLKSPYRRANHDGADSGFPQITSCLGGQPVASSLSRCRMSHGSERTCQHESNYKNLIIIENFVTTSGL